MQMEFETFFFFFLISEDANIEHLLLIPQSLHLVGAHPEDSGEIPLLILPSHR